MLYGIDISHYNNPSVKTLESVDFLIHKATEGKSYTDKSLTDHVTQYTFSQYSVNKPALLGFYHFARPQNGNTPAQEAEHFLKVVQHHIHSALLVLDVEAGAENYVDWCVEWLQYIYSKTQVRPLLYTSSSNCNKLARCLTEADTGLWVANYKNSGNLFPLILPNKVKPWKTCAMWQWTNGTYKPGNKPGTYYPEKVDQNVFNGTQQSWKLYAGSETLDPKPEPCTHCPIHCPED